MRLSNDGAEMHRRMYRNAICETGTLNVGFNEDNMVVAYFKTFRDSYTWCHCDLTHLFVLVGKSAALNSVLSGTTVYLCQASLLNDTHVVLQASGHVSCQERERHQLRC